MKNLINSIAIAASILFLSFLISCGSGNRHHHGGGGSDTTPPDTQITAQPSDPTTQQGATFSFSCADSSLPCTFQCQMDSAGFSTCTSPIHYASLSEGSHTFDVRAIDSANNTDASPASYTWTVDITAPDTAITSQPVDPSNQQNATFTFTCTEGPCLFECQMDADGWSACASPKNYVGLSEDSHTFQVRATDAVGNPDSTPASYTWAIDVTPPDTQITAHPANLSNSSSASFSFTCTDVHIPCTFECSMDSGAFTDCNSPANYSGLSEASHTFHVQATDAAGNTDPTPASYLWIIDLPPDTIITSNPDDPTNSTSALFSFICDEPPCTFECNLDSSGWSTCSSPQTYGTSGIDTWTATSTTSAPSERYIHTAVWTGTEMIVWGGYDGSFYLNTGSRYNPATDSWTANSTTNAPVARDLHTAIWTGTEMIVWGGFGYLSSRFNSGGRYNPATDSWTATATTNAPSARNGHSAVWTGTEMVVWGGCYVDEYDNQSLYNDGGRYNPATDSWIATSITNAPEARFAHTAVWTGNEMIMWGGGSNTGGRYNPATDSWTATSTTNAPEWRVWQTAVWTGHEMIVWGGIGISWWNTGGRYNPATDSWVATATANAPSARYWQTGIWTGKEMIVWGGIDSSSSRVDTGGIYNPATDSWIATSTTNAPSGRGASTAIWTGNEMIVWGGEVDYYTYSNTGGIYRPALSEGNHSFAVRAYDAALNVDPTPATYSWTIDLKPPITSLTSAPANPSSSADADFEFNCNETSCSFECNLDSSGWTACSSPWVYLGLASGDHTFSVQATDAAGNLELNPLVYAWTISINPPDTFITSHPPNPSNSSSASFGFDCNAGPCNFECKLDSGSWISCTSPANYSTLNDGFHTFLVRASDLNNNRDLSPASYTWTIDTIAPDTTITSKPPSHSNTTDANFSFTCNDTGCTFKCQLDSGSWIDCTSPQNYSGLDQGNHTFKVYATDWVGYPDPTPANFSWIIDLMPPDTTITSHPPDPSNSGIASFSFICDEPPCTFECNMDSSGWSSCSSPNTYNNGFWTETSVINAPTSRYGHTSVWTDAEMIVWGGYAGDCLNTGGRYSPATDSWIATSTINAPTARLRHTAVWSGTEMIVWGGLGGTLLNTGGRYNPATDSWIATSITSAPKARCYHTAVWAGTRMIVWGGQDTYGMETGGRYNPETDSWAATSLTNVPGYRYCHTAVWTGTEMIVWGGKNTSALDALKTGGRYNHATDTWAATSTTNAAGPRYYHTAVWTGTEMIVWGGYNGLSNLNTGGKYNPATNSWIATSITNAPAARQIHTAVWTDSEMIIWGGNNGGATYFNTGGIYNPASNSWMATSLINAPSARATSGVWTGSEMIVWGGIYDPFPYYLNTGGRYRLTLSEGTHFFAVRAYDAALNVDPTPATYGWTVDLTPPITSLTSAPANPTSSTDADFEFNCNETGCTFECNLDSAGWSTCSSPAQYSGLSVGDHVFSVFARDPAGNWEPDPLIYPWTIQP